MFVADEKRCGRCGEVKPGSAFNRLGDGRQHWCRECFREYFRARGDLHRQQSGDAQRKRRARQRAFLDDYLASHPCRDCGETDVRVLEFDHVGDKAMDIAALWRLGRSLAELEAEVRRCEVVCVNCHRRRTATRARWWRCDPTHPPPPTQPARATRNLRFIYAELARSRCIDCGETDIVVLEFDHVGEKRDAVTKLAWGGYSIETLRQEIARCEVRCCNCHRRMTLERRHWVA
jgi:hypothetical protein